ncbi:IS4 family transposase [Hymenobacter siberiensis]|uniref:IS4 family transposase n=1 Tax=Hymenobacter siberiensis TaxID=2848396 RepID=UPI001C1DF458|nr:IS4 family transposase [Hymenobacter siberiensis]
MPLLGLLAQQYHVRQPVPAAEKDHPPGGSRLRQGRVRESALWSRSLRQVGRPPAGTRWVVVAATGKGDPIPCAVVRVWEAAEADSATPGLEWLLLCDQPVTDFAQAQACARQYVSRWLIEDFHKALKTGLGAEKLQLQTAERLFAAVALLSVVALALVDMREKSRLQPDLPATAAGLEATFLRVLALRSHRPVQTVRDVYDALCGHLGRKGDGPPGWQTLWRGLMSLRLLVEGVRLATQLDQP